MDALKFALERDNAILIGDYTKLSRESNVTIKCNCGKNATKKLRAIYKIGATCKTCTKRIKVERAQRTWIENYGVSNPSKVQEIMEKMKKTCKEIYGVEHPLQCQKVLEKVRQTCKERYGAEFLLQLEQFKEKAKNTTLERFGTEYAQQSEIFKEVVRKTCIERYGVEHTLQVEEFRQKGIQTYIERYGVEHHLQLPEFMEKLRQTCQERYGVDCVSQLLKVKEKMRQTCIQRYGVEHPLQCQEVLEKNQKSGRKYKEYTMPSGIVRKVQGYEPFALRDLLQTHKEEGIKTDRKDIPRIAYETNGKTRYYFPDIYLPSTNTIIEVKSTWTYKSKTDSIKEKEDATKAAGYNYDIWIYDGKGNRVDREKIEIPVATTSIPDAPATLP